MHALQFVQHNVVGLLWAVAIFSFMILIHEFGHFMIAKLSGVKVLEFAFGFGPRLLRLKKGETEYALRLFPFGGFVKMYGEAGEGSPTEPGHFQGQSLGKRIAVVAAGPLMNYALAIVLFFVVGAAFGLNTYVFEIGGLLPDMPATRAGILPGDQILAINGQSFQSAYDPESLIREEIQKIQNSPGVPLHLFIARGSRRIQMDVTPAPNKDGKGLLGVRPRIGILFEKQGVFPAFRSSFISTWYFTKTPLIEIGKIFQGKRKAAELAHGSAGPIGMANLIVSTYNQHKASGQAVAYLLWLAAVLNVFIGLFNLFPIPALDGSHILFAALGGAFGKPLNPKLEESIHLVGLGVLLILIALVTYQDIMRILLHKGF